MVTPHHAFRFSFFLRSLLLPLLIAVMTTIGATTAVFAAPLAQTCTNGGTFTLGKYYINNNLWGASSGSGWQCISTSSGGGATISWYTNWSWSGSPYSVKSYASSVLGWQWGYKLSNTGLPVKISSKRSVRSSWSFRVSGSNTLDVSYDNWITSSTNASSPSAELMIWLYRSGGAGPLGSAVRTVSLDGASWTLYHGTNGWPVYSFVRTSNTTSASLNVMDFVQNLGGSLNSSYYLAGVESGTEVFTGTGSLTTSSYSVTVG